MKKKLVSIVLATVLIMAQSVMAFCETIPEGYYHVRNANSNMYLDCAGTTSGSNIRQYLGPIYSVPQKFLALSTGDGYYTMSPSTALNMAVAVYNASPDNAANVLLNDYNGTDGQKWKYLPNSNGSFRIASKCSNDTRVLAVENASTTSGANVYQYQYNFDTPKYEQWFLEAVVPEGTYMIKNKTTGLYLTFNGENTVMKQSAYGQGICQQFVLDTSEETYYEIMPLTNQEISVQLSQATEGADVGFAFGQGNEVQNWRFIVNPDGSYRIVSQASTCKMAIVPNTTSNYIHSYTYSQALSNAGWELIRVE